MLPLLVAASGSTCAAAILSSVREREREIDGSENKLVAQVVLAQLFDSDSLWSSAGMYHSTQATDFNARLQFKSLLLFTLASSRWKGGKGKPLPVAFVAGFKCLVKIDSHWQTSASAERAYYRLERARARRNEESE